MTVSATDSRTRVVRPRSRVGTRLALFLLPVVIIPLVVQGAAAYLRAQALLRQQAVSRIASTVEAQAATVRAWIFSRDGRIGFYAQSEALRNAVAEALASPTPVEPAALRQQLDAIRVLGDETLFSTALVVRSSDGVVVASNAPEFEGATIDAVRSGKLPADALQTTSMFDVPGLAPGSFAVVTSAPIRAPGTEGEALLVGVSRGPEVNTLLGQLQADWSERVGTAESAGTVYLAVAPDVLVAPPASLTATEPEVHGGIKDPVFGLMQANPVGTGEYGSFDGLPVVGAYQRIDEPQLGVVMEVPQSEVYAGLGSLAPFTVALAVIAAILSLAIILIVTSRQLRPLGQLAEFADRLSRGEWEHRVPETRDDEIGALASSFNRMADDLSALYGSLEARVAERTQQVRTAAEVARAVTSTPSLDDLLRRAVDLLRDRFGFYHVTIFMLDEEGANAVVRESTGEVGQLLKARGHSLAVGSSSIIGWVTANNQGRIATDVGRDPIHLKNELLPDTRSEAAVPLQVTGRVLGALDVQSKEVNAFSAETLEVLQALADQLSTAIQNARLAQQSSLAAERARLLSAVTGQFGGLMDIEHVLETAAHTLHRVLGQPEVIITLAPEAGAGTEGGDGRE